VGERKNQGGSLHILFAVRLELSVMVVAVAKGALPERREPRDQCASFTTDHWHHLPQMADDVKGVAIR